MKLTREQAQSIVFGTEPGGAYRKNAQLAPSEVELILEVAYLTIAADHALRPEEIETYTALGEVLTGGDKRTLESTMDRFQNDRTRDEAIARLRTIGDMLASDEGRRAAYRISVALAASDLAVSDEEFEHDLDLQDALHLSPSLAEQLAGDVHEALRVED